VHQLQGKVAVITGAASGIGLGIARRFAAQGMSLVLADVDAERLATEADALGAGGSHVLAIPTDVGDAHAVERLAKASFGAHGRVDVLVNNAGVLAGGYSWELPLAEWQRVLQVNLWGVIHGIHSFVPRLLEQDHPSHVVNIGSMASVVPVPRIGPYNVAKHGLLALSEGLAAELVAAGRPDIAVTLVMPGRVGSRLGGGEPDPAVMDPDDLGDIVVQVLHERPLFRFTHPERVAEVERRFERILAAGEVPS
jgi:NAD(P)-dependent dehydrogenase (short-subunit alcohol dehydrogenase family)